MSRRSATLDVDVSIRVTGTRPELQPLVAELEALSADDRDAPPRFEVAPTDGARWELRHPDGRIDLWKTEAEAVGQLIGTLNRYLPEHSSHVALHAGAVARSGDAVVFPAVSGSGKSTIVTNLVGAGCDYLGDEIIGVTSDASHLVAYHKPISLRSTSLPEVPFGRPPLLLVTQGKAEMWQLPVRGTCGPERIVSDAVVRHVVIPRFIPGAETALVPLRPAAALHMVATGGFRNRRSMAERLDVLAAMLTEVSAHQLVIGDSQAAAQAVLDLAGWPGSTAQPTGEARGA